MATTPELDFTALDRAARLIRGAHALLLSSGAGMGVDSGMPDYRGDQGFWNAYPPYRHLGLNFVEMANPRWFRSDPRLAWGFYGHRRNLYRRLAPHRGFQILRRWGAAKPGGCFVLTSNVDGHYQAAGFAEEQILEVHGTLEHEQCMAKCGAGIYPAPAGEIEVDEQSMRARGPLPSCPRCGGLSRPNNLMFGDWGWKPQRENGQNRNFERWLEQVEEPLLVIECGAGTGLPTIRELSEHYAGKYGALLRINLREPQVPATDHQLGIAGGALPVLEALDALVRADNS